MFVTLTRILKYGIQGFIRNGWLSTSTIVIMVLAMIMFEGLLLFNVVTERAITALQEKIDISVYFKSNVSEDSILDLKRAVENLAEVKKVEYISKEQALEEFKTDETQDATIRQALEELGANPLLPSLNIKANDPNEYKTIADYLNKPSLGELIEKISYTQNQVIIERLTRMVNTGKTAGIVVTNFLALVAIIVTFNTIRLAIYSNSEQISIMRLVGASNAFIRGPFIVEGILYGILSGIAGFLLWIPVIQFASPYVMNFIPEMKLVEYFNENFLNLLLYNTLFGIGLGIVSSAIAIRKYLRI